MNELISRLDSDVSQVGECAVCQAVKKTLAEAVLADEFLVPEKFLEPVPDRYARRLLHRDPAGRYTVLVMVWDNGQGTPLHDHAAMWCVECVYRGRICVTSYSLEGEQDGMFHFERQTEIFAESGEAGALIPPFDYHSIRNQEECPAITIHVYGQEMTWCNAFLPEDGSYRKVRRELSYT